MKTKVLTASLLLCLSFQQVAAQSCAVPYNVPLFDVRVEQGVVYDTVVDHLGQVMQIAMDIHKPIGDGQQQRPLVIMVHGGAFVEGDRSDMSELCDQLAACGWVAATISYRLGFHPLAPLPIPFAYDEAEVVRAAYRGLLDTRSSIRFLKARSAQDSTDVDRVVLLGGSAGAINTLHAAYGRNEALRPAASGALAPVVIPEGTYERPDLGPMGAGQAGEPDDDVLAVVSFLGGIIDTAMITSATDPALFMYHQTGDPIVGCGHERGLWGMPFGVSNNYPYLFGSCMIDLRAQHLGYTPERYRFIEHPGNEHDVHDLPAMFTEAVGFMRDQVCGNTVGMGTTIARTTAQVHPNPSSGAVVLPEDLFTRGPVRVRVMDGTGRAVRDELLHTPAMDLSGLPAGSYLLTTPTGEHMRVVRQ